MPDSREIAAQKAMAPLALDGDRSFKPERPRPAKNPISGARRPKHLPQSASRLFAEAAGEIIKALTRSHRVRGGNNFDLHTREVFTILVPNVHQNSSGHVHSWLAAVCEHRRCKVPTAYLR